MSLKKGGVGLWGGLEWLDLANENVESGLIGRLYGASNLAGRGGCVTERGIPAAEMYLDRALKGFLFFLSGK